VRRIADDVRARRGLCVTFVMIALFTLPLKWEAGQAPCGLCPWRRWILAYTGGPKRAAYSAVDFERLLTVVDTAGNPVGRAFDGVVFLEITRRGDHGFTPLMKLPGAPASDWEWFRDTLFAPSGFLQSLDSAGSLLTARGLLDVKLGVAVMIPYPFGTGDTLTYDGQRFKVADGDPGRVSLVRTYVHDVVERFRRSSYRHVTPVAMYWLVEDAKGSDTSLIRAVAGVVHAEGLRFFWIPYYNAAGADRWADWGFDDSWLQPNYLFSLNATAARFDSVAHRVFAHSMGVELEVNRRVLNDTLYRPRFAPYLQMLDTHPELLRGPIAVYDDAGVLLDMWSSRDPAVRRLYERFGRLMIQAGRQP
jgi:hypothetical protein